MVPTYNGLASTLARKAAASSADSGSAHMSLPTRTPVSSISTPFTVVRLRTSCTPSMAASCVDSVSITARVPGAKTSRANTPTSVACSLPKALLISL